MAMAVRNRLELLQQREQGMLAVIESAQDLSSRLNLTSLLRAIVSKARNLLGVGPRVAVDARRRARRVPRHGRRRCAVAQRDGHGRAPRPRRRQPRDDDAPAVHHAGLPARPALRTRRAARRHLPRRGHHGAGGRAAGLGRRGHRPAVRGGPLSPRAHRAEHLDPVHARDARRRRAAQCARLRARQRGAGERRHRAFRARAALARHPGRRRCARADDFVAVARRVAGDAVRLGGAAARRQPAGAGRRPPRRSPAAVRSRMPATRPNATRRTASTAPTSRVRCARAARPAARSRPTRRATNAAA